MSEDRKFAMGRRSFLATGTAFIGAPALAQDINSEATTEVERDITETVRRNTSSFRSMRWEPYFDNLKNGAILVDITSRALHFWGEDGTYKLYPSSVPLTEDLTRRRHAGVFRLLFGQAEVGHTRLSGLIQQYISGFQIAVNHSLIIGIGDGLRNLDEKFRRLS